MSQLITALLLENTTLIAMMNGNEEQEEKENNEVKKEVLFHSASNVHTVKSDSAAASVARSAFKPCFQLFLSLPETPPPNFG